MQLSNLALLGLSAATTLVAASGSLKEGDAPLMVAARVRKHHARNAAAAAAAGASPYNNRTLSTRGGDKKAHDEHKKQDKPKSAPEPQHKEEHKEAPKPAAKKSEHKDEHKPAPKADHKPAHKDDKKPASKPAKKPEHKADNKPQHKDEHKGKPQHKDEHKGKPAPKKEHKQEHKGKPAHKDEHKKHDSKHPAAGGKDHKKHDHKHAAAGSKDHKKDGNGKPTHKNAHKNEGKAPAKADHKKNGHEAHKANQPKANQQHQAKSEPQPQQQPQENEDEEECDGEDDGSDNADNSSNGGGAPSGSNGGGNGGSSGSSSNKKSAGEIKVASNSKKSSSNNGSNNNNNGDLPKAFQKGKFGLCYAEPDIDLGPYVQNSQVSWSYNWEATPYAEDGGKMRDDVAFIPMLWSGPGKDNESGSGSDRFGQWQKYIESNPTSGNEYLRDGVIAGPNEVDLSSQGNLSPGEACDLMKNHMLNVKHSAGVKLIGPSSIQGDSWYKQFRDQCSEVYNEIDYDAVHDYNIDPQTTINKFTSWYQEFKKPLVITEYGCYNYGNAQGDCSDPGKAEWYMKTVAEWAKNTDYVIGIAYYGVMKSSNIGWSNQLSNGDGSPTQLAQSFKAVSN